MKPAKRAMAGSKGSISVCSANPNSAARFAGLNYILNCSTGVPLRSTPGFMLPRAPHASLPHDLARVLVVANSEEARVAEFVVFGPLDETDLNDDLRSNPMRA